VGDLDGAVLDGRYRVGSRLADGAMGTVYRGERLGLGRQVAIKVMQAVLPGELAARERFAREAELMAKLAHPHCVSVIDFGLHDDCPFLVMELVRGVSLHELIVAEHRLPPRRAAEIARQILAGLAHAHALGIVHRDIKPANIMVSPKEGLGDHVQILDFGLARLRESNTQLTAGIAVGTPSYMAPEQCRGAPADARVDLYACGVVMFEMLAGRKPFVAADPIEIVRQHLTAPPPRVADVLGEPCELDDVIARALAKSPDDRFASAIEMAAAIDAVVPAPVTRAATPLPIPPEDSIPLLGSSVITPIDEPPPPMPPPSQASTPIDPHELSTLRRALPASRMKWMALLLLLLAAGVIYGIIYAKHWVIARG
jgi:serine/threonine-protein kinase